ncbi:MAG: divalent-cation tolerance protein CutA [Candidatus Omnitrophota bacterium]
MEKFCIVYVTASNKAEIVRIGKELVSQRLAACANVFDGCSSFYHLEGEMQEDAEVLLILKTRECLLPEVEKEIKKLHSYSCPCIIAFPIIHVSKEYAEWLDKELIQ